MPCIVFEVCRFSEELLASIILPTIMTEAANSSVFSAPFHYNTFQHILEDKISILTTVRNSCLRLCLRLQLTSVSFHSSLYSDSKNAKWRLGRTNTPHWKWARLKMDAVISRNLCINYFPNAFFCHIVTNSDLDDQLLQVKSYCCGLNYRSI
jgi:hypothetical protein